MNQKQTISAITAAILAWAIAFQGGRTTAIAKRKSEAIGRAKSDAAFSQKQNLRTDLVDEHKLIVGNLANVSFSELYDLLQSVLPETRAHWAKQVDAMLSGPQKIGAIETFYKTLVQIDPHAAAQLALQMNDPRLQAIAVGAMIGAAPESAMAEMAAAAVQVPQYYRTGDLDKALNYWSEVDPVAASHFVEEHPKDASPLDIIYNWAAIDPDAARNWLDRVLVERKDDEEHAAAAISGLCEGWRETDQAGALNYAVAHADEGRFKRAILDLSSSLFLDSPEQARSFIERLPNDQSKKAAVDEVVMITTGVILGGSPDWPRPPEVVAKWIATLPNEAWGEQIGWIVGRWADMDESGLRNWLDQLPTENRDQIIASYCESPHNRGPEPAVTIAMKISNEALRTRSLHQLLKNFGTKEETRALLQNSKLPLETKRYLTRLLESDQ